MVEEDVDGWGSGGTKISRRFRRTSVIEENLNGWGSGRPKVLRRLRRTWVLEENMGGWGSGGTKVSMGLRTWVTEGPAGPMAGVPMGPGGDPGVRVPPPTRRDPDVPVWQLTPIERYAMNFLEASLEDVSREELKQAEVGGGHPWVGGTHCGVRDTYYGVGGT